MSTQTKQASKRTAVEIASTVATVRVELENWTGYRFTDMLTLLRVGDRWLIVNKVFHHAV